MTAALLASGWLLLGAAAGDASPASGVPPTGPPTEPAAAANPAPAPSPAPGSEPRAERREPDLEAQAALRTTQDLEAQLIEIRRELEGLEKQRAAWDDLRRNLDELVPRVDELARRADQPPPSRARTSSPLAEPGAQLRAADGSTFPRPQLRLQAGYQGALVQRPLGQVSAPDSSTFLIQYAEVMFEGNVFQRRVEYRLLVDLAAPTIVKDAFVQWRQSAWLAVRVGQFKLPFGFQRYLRSTYYDFVDLSETMAAFSLERDIGAMLVGRPLGGRLQYQLAITNGAGAGKLNENRDLAYTARIVAAPWGALPESEGDLVGQRRPLLAVGLAGHFNLLPTDVVARTNDPAANTDVDNNGRVDSVAVWQGAVELRLHFRGAALQGELFRRLEHPGAGAPDRDTGGEYLQASYFVIPHFLAVAGRVERTDLPLYGATLAKRDATGSRITAQTAGVSAFFHGHDLKLQADYTHLKTDDIVVTAGSYSSHANRLRVSAQLMF